ncbi:Nucleoside triphosphate pyrophosphohydrolase MazG [hydrothermal vent metagenome]|uniref:Nucleoside triphosphate pyrophosphohydrolase MazG n=1 Tax=hydrothermal vent metagenome TaxID=652676 RepID=A0A3B0Y683_9ZZZZ
MNQKNKLDVGGISTLLDIMARLRNPDGGCPWDLQQDFASIAPYTLEEAYEVVDAIERDQPDELCDELGDLLFQVVFHARMASEKGWFDFAGVVDAINTKMVRRHPHVFGDERIADADAQSVAWEQHKARERAEQGREEDTSALANIPVGLPALARAQKIQRCAARVGFDWEKLDDVLEKLEEEVAELREAVSKKESRRRQCEELGDVLFSCVNLARFLDADAEQVLRNSNEKFTIRFCAVEQLAEVAGRELSDCSVDELEAFWQQAKRDTVIPEV